MRSLFYSKYSQDTPRGRSCFPTISSSAVVGVVRGIRHLTKCVAGHAIEASHHMRGQAGCLEPRRTLVSCGHSCRALLFRTVANQVLPSRAWSRLSGSCWGPPMAHTWQRGDRKHNQGKAGSLGSVQTLILHSSDLIVNCGLEMGPAEGVTAFMTRRRRQHTLV